jgi:putative SOS response-associated peptidase YedK
MCGRFGLWTTDRDIPGFTPSYNISPGSTTPVWVKQSPNSIKLLKWGIKDKIINARAEGITEKYLFKKLIFEKRCLILANGFYEWNRLNLEGKEEKIPWFFGLKGFPVFCFAGIYDEENRFAIITTTPNETIKRVHHRMPVVISSDKEDNWLDRDTHISDIISFLKPYPDENMIGYPVSYRVNNPINNDPTLITPIK